MTNYLSEAEKIHKPGCKVNMHCLVNHLGNPCPGPYGTCTCDSLAKEKEYRQICAMPKCRNPVPRDVHALDSKCDGCFNKPEPKKECAVNLLNGK